MRDLPKKVYK